MYFWITVLVICIVAAFSFCSGLNATFRKLFIGAVSDATDVAKRPREPGKPYYREGAEGEEILASATDVKIDAYVPVATHSSLLFQQLAIPLPSWHLVKFNISMSEVVETMKKELSSYAGDTRHHATNHKLQHITRVVLSMARTDGRSGDSGGEGGGRLELNIELIKEYLNHKLEVRYEHMKLTEAGAVVIEAAGHAETHTIKKLAYDLVSVQMDRTWTHARANISVTA